MPGKVKILVVDDYRENITAISNLIAADDVEIHAAMNADQALDLLTLHDFGLALVDVQMPEVSGFELARLIRGVKRFRSLPIIFVTAHQEDRAVIFLGYETGAVDLMFKPLDPHVVRSKVRVFVELQQQRELLKEHVRELENLRIDAEAANIAKSQFLANMSHEIRTPVAAVMGFAELIAGGNLSGDEKQEAVSSISRNGTLLLRLIDDILDISRIEANRLELERVDFDLSEVFRDVQSTLSFKAREKGVDLEIAPPAGKLPMYSSDPIRIKQVLLNVIGNAIKFTNQGKVRVEAEIAGGPTSDRLCVTVADEGVGLTAEQATRLFRPFGQADASTRRQFGGSGLGLVISRQIARNLEGDIRLVSSEPGKGSTFEIAMNLPRATGVSATAAKPSTATSVTAATARFAGKKILAVDDSPDNLTLIDLFLRSSNAQLTFVDSGPKALEEASRDQFDLVLMDVQMPGMDGNEATRTLRERGFVNPIIALTAHAIPSEHDRCREAGCDDVLVKPISREGLIEGLTKHLG